MSLNPSAFHSGNVNQALSKYSSPIWDVSTVGNVEITGLSSRSIYWVTSAVPDPYICRLTQVGSGEIETWLDPGTGTEIKSQTWSAVQSTIHLPQENQSWVRMQGVLYVDTIQENTATAGTIVEGTLMKDAYLDEHPGTGLFDAKVDTTSVIQISAITHRISIGDTASAGANWYIQLGKNTATGLLAQGYFYSQKFADEAWIGGGVSRMAYIGALGSMQKADNALYGITYDPGTGSMTIPGKVISPTCLQLTTQSVNPSNDQTIWTDRLQIYFGEIPIGSNTAWRTSVEGTICALEKAVATQILATSGGTRINLLPASSGCATL
jgi:hypothetical protein